MNTIDLHIVRYYLSKSFGEMYSSDWIVTHLIINDVSYEIAFVYLAELEQLVRWIKSIRTKKTVKNIFDFVDPNVRFEYVDAKSVALILVFDASESCYLLSMEMLENLIISIEKQLECFPCRCLHRHEIFD